MFFFTQSGITQEAAMGPKIWSFPELLETPDPLSGEPLPERNAAIRKSVEIVTDSAESLSEMAQLQIDFWKNIQPEKISERTYIYASTPGSDKRWELTIHALGLFYKDLSGEYYYPPGKVTEQLFSDFWFYGPLQPVPELKMREKLLDLIRETFLDPDCPASRAHFELFEYPELTGSELSWTTGDYNRRDYVDVKSNGIETGYSTWRDTQPMMWFTSFENFLHEPPRPYSSITPEMREKIEQFLGRKSVVNRPKAAASGAVPEEPPAPPPPPTPREKMDLAESLLKADPNSAKGAETLISLLEYEDEETYWRNYVFNYFFKLRGNKTVERFILECLQGDSETHFKKAVDVLQMWGFHYGDKSFQDKALYHALNWEDATANDPEFRAALEKTIKILDQPPS